MPAMIAVSSCVPEVAEEADKELIAGTRDDEYRWAGVEDPKILITTSHSPSSKLKEFAKASRGAVNQSQILFGATMGSE